MLGIFYFFGLILCLLNLSLLSQFHKVLKIKEWAISFKKVSGKEPSKTDFKSKEYDLFLSSNSVLILNFFWLFFGLITSEWRIFGLLMIISSILNLFGLLFLKYKFRTISNLLQYIKMLTITIIVGLLVMNHFHFHIDMWTYLTKLK